MSTVLEKAAVSAAQVLGACWPAKSDRESASSAKNRLVGVQRGSGGRLAEQGRQGIVCGHWIDECKP